MKTDLPEKFKEVFLASPELVIAKAETYLDAMSLLSDAAASWINCNTSEIEAGLEKVRAARNLFWHCDAHEEMQWIISAVEMQLLGVLRELWNEEAREKRNHGGNVYFLQSKETGLIKVGFSKQPKTRTKNIMVAHHDDAEVIGFIPGSSKTERSIHKSFSKDHKRGEWFFPSPELVGFIMSFSSVVPGNAQQIEMTA